jgi:hypothetical protein
METKQIDMEFVHYEQALALKELGFDEPCIAGYDEWTPEDEKPELKSVVNEMGILSGIKGINLAYTIIAPLYQQAFRWFREKYNIISEIRNWNGTSNQWYYMIHHNDELLPWRWIENTSYEEAELACLIKLIEIVKQNGN